MTTLKTNKVAGLNGTNAIDGSLFFNHGYLSMDSGEIISGTGFGTNDFTVEFWINQGVNASNYTILLSLTSSTAVDRFEVAFHSSTIHVYTDTGTWRDTGYAPTAGVYEHIAFQRDYSGNTLKMYANGVEKWSVSNTRDYDEAFETFIGLHSSAYGYLEGYISNLRVCTHLVYASNNFTPPTQKLGLHHETVLLCCQDSNNPLQEATGKTITGHGNLSAPNINLVPNGDFTNGQTSWTVGGANNQSVTGTTMRVSNDSSTNGRSTGAAFETVDGAVYRIKYNAVNSSSATFRFEIRESSGGGSEQAFQDTSAGPKEYYFTATESQHCVVIYAIGSGTSWAEYANIRVEAVTTYANAPKVLPSVGIDAGTVLDGGVGYDSLNYMTLPKGTTTQSNRGRGLIMGGFYPEILTMEHVSLISSANSIKFGDLGSSSIAWGGAGASSTRAVIGGGAIPAVINNIEYVTIATLGDAINFGDLDVAKRHAGTVSNETKALWGGGETASSNTMTAQVDSVTIATTGDAADFGDLTVARRGSAPASSATRGVWSAGQFNASDFNNVIDYVTIATTGNATDFGDTIATRANHAGCSNNIRGIIGTGTAPAPGAVPNTIDYITIASTGNSTDFGDLYLATYSGGAMASQIRGMFVGGANHPGGIYQNIIQYVTIATTGNAMDFGDMATLRGSYDGNTSDCHGGLGQ